MAFCSGEYGGFCKNPALLPMMCCLIDFVDIVHTVHNFMRRKEVVSSIFGKELIISKIKELHFRSGIFHGILGSDNSLILRYFQA